MISFVMRMRGELLEFQANPNRAVQSIYEDIPGGCTLYKSELKNGATGTMSEGIMISVGSDRIGHLVKTGATWESFTASSTGINICKANEFKAGDSITDTLFTRISRRIVDIDSSHVLYDRLNIGSGFGASGWAGMVLVEVAASGASGADCSLRYVPDGIGVSEQPLDLARMSAGMGVMVRGTVREANMPYPIDEHLKALFPLVRFV